MKDFNDKIIVITGGASGIGLSFAKIFGDAGAKIVIADINEAKSNHSLALLKERGIDCASQICDVSDYEQMKALADFTLSQYGRADVIMNGAAIGGGGKKFFEEDISAIHKIVAINYFGVLYGSHIFGKYFIERGTPAAIYNIGSENSFFVDIPRMVNYQATKHAVWGLTEALRQELPDFIDIALIIPGWVKTPLTSRLEGGMDVDRFTKIIFEQLKRGQSLAVSHAYNIERITNRFETIKRAFDEFAPRYQGDDEYDIITTIRKLQQKKR